jgi:hypothetical protein
MNETCFVLFPFERSILRSTVSNLQISGRILRVENTLTLDFRLCSPVGEILIPDRAETPLRQDDLWQSTCFECFLAAKGRPQYWEFNLSPAGHWNVYRFTHPRQGMTEEVAFTALPFECRFTPLGLSLVWSVDLGRIIPADQALEIGVTAVLEHRNRQKSYWALSHPGLEADFHRRDSFKIELA